MIRKPIPRFPKIILLANGLVGLEISKYLIKSKDHIVGLVLHSRGKGQLSKEIRNLVRPKYVFFAQQLENKSVLKKIKEMKPDLAISAWFGYLLQKEFISIFPSGCINFHNSYLPYNRGKYPHVWAINNQNIPYGVTLHFIDEGIDTGDIIKRKKITIDITDTAQSLYQKSLKEIVQLFIRNWEKIRNNKIKPIKQTEILASHHYAKDVVDIDLINLSQKYTGLEFINKLRSRSFSDRSYSYFLYNGKKIYVKITLARKHLFN